MSFVCEVRGCESPAKIGGKCVKHACEAYRQKHGPEDREEETDEKGPKEEAMGEKKCSECGQEPKEGERLYREKCPECRNKGKAERKPRSPKRRGKASTPSPSKSVAPSPSTGESRGEGEALKDTPPPPMAAPPTGDIVSKLQTEFYRHLNEAKTIHTLLTDLKRLSGANISIPDINF